MKKILGISIVAMLAVVPMMAQATPVAVTPAVAGGEPYQGVALDQDAHIATTSYVQGAYNAAIGAVNDLAGKKQDNLTTDATGTPAIDTTVKTSMTTDAEQASATALVTEKAIATALASVNSIADAAQTEAEVKALIGGAAAGASDGLTGDTTNGTLAVNYDNTTIGVIASGNDAGKLEVKNGSITADKLGAEAVTTAKIDDEAVTAAKIATGTITTTQVAASSMQGATDTDTYTNTKLATGAYVDEKVAGAISTAVGTGDNALQTKSQVETLIGSNAQTATFTPTATGLSSTSIGAAINEVATDAATALGNKRVTVYTTWGNLENTQQVALSEATAQQDSNNNG